MTTQTTLDQLEALIGEHVLMPIDVEFCRFLSELESDAHPQVLLAACLTSMAYQNGDVCISLDEYAGRALFDEAPKDLQYNAPLLNKWLESLSKSALVGRPGEFKPLILDEHHRLYFHKQWKNEQMLVNRIIDKVKKDAGEVNTDVLKNGVNRMFGNGEPIDWQKVAAVASVFNSFTVISGGPGTGKTTTVVRLLALLVEQGIAADDLPSIALAAPTGKAAARLEESIIEAKDDLQTSEQVKEAIPVDCQTMHQLLGASRYTARFRHNQDNPLPYDYIIIDEVSMVDQALMGRLMEATLAKTRLLLLGDKDQLASVEAGSVLGDLCGDRRENQFSETMKQRFQNLGIKLPDSTVSDNSNPLLDNVVLLTKSYRFGANSGIGKLAKAVNTGKADEAWKLLSGDTFTEITAHDFEDYSEFLNNLFKPILQRFKHIQQLQSPEAILEKYKESQILAAHRKGPWGVGAINSQMEQLLKKSGLISPYDEWYTGRPIIINANDYGLGLSNGDLGVCSKDGDGAVKVFFESDEGLLAIAPARLPQHSTAFALTVHKSQGSEFSEISFVLPQQSSKILSRELVYTAISRARNSLKLYGNQNTFSLAVQRTAARKSGLKDHLWE